MATAKHHPFNAGATASCTLWCGLPVLTVPGDRLACRYGASLLAAVGLPELIAPDIGAYGAIAVDLARFRPRLREARGQSLLLLQRYACELPPDTIDLAVAD
ncbi:hypothetical protein [Burkholderia lata]|uniref:O-linked N-acetylglucosamine transferase family protein n=1 Tax=Burkholderia lata (strain ATCC 17760 / DSM 23089 / LMG 22485 / NCIMB 9086 / R18194 / 383) TaxID=482957 RepID=UPI0024318EE9|nr:hypothetical protein [Burkholderia lata]